MKIKKKKKIDHPLIILNILLTNFVCHDTLSSILPYKRHTGTQELYRQPDRYSQTPEYKSDYIRTGRINKSGEVDKRNKYIAHQRIDRESNKENKEGQSLKV